MSSRIVVLCFLVCGCVALFAAGPASAGAIFGSLASDGTDGAVNFTDNANRYHFNTDTGEVWHEYHATGGWTGHYTDLAAGAGREATASGVTLHVWDFTTFSTTESELTVEGSQPGGILAQGNIYINRNVYATAARGSGGHGLTAGGGLGGGKAAATDGKSAGGAGYVRDGKPGFTGGLLTADGGDAYADWHYLRGGSGGGGSHGAGMYGEGWPDGGAGGGALLFSTPGEFTVDAGGSILADGGAGYGAYDYAGSSGGGSGGYLAFAVGGTLTNKGMITAKGGAGGVNGSQVGGKGSGGMIYLDPASIVNTGTFSVAGYWDDPDLMGLIGLAPGMSIDGG
ncbi:MAG: hypothetical protein NT049_10985 [Planctomycetota bacterium]|nr:hypothetical protein [Planctomycetota bacterium]